MKISELENLVLKNVSKFNLARGKKILEDKKLSKLNIHKIEGTYNIYGSFKSDKNSHMYNPHLKINLREKKIIYAKCGCEMFNDFHGSNGIYLCEHLAAIGLGFVNQVKIKLSQKNRLEKTALKDDRYILGKLRNICSLENDLLEERREKLNINITLKENVSDNESFSVSLFVGNSNMYPIMDINQFIISVVEKKEYHIGKGLLYKNENYYFNEEDKNIIEYLYEYSLIYKNDKSGMTLNINKEVIGNLLKRVKNNKVKFVYGYQTYISEVYESIFPVSFTLKCIRDEYVLTTKKDFPIPLNKRENVFLFDRKIYIPSEREKEIYKILRQTLKEKGRAVFSKDTSSYELLKLVSYLKVISEDINLDNGIIEKIDSALEIEFNFERYEDKFYCRVFLKYDNNRISYEDALKSTDEIIKDSKKIYLIESELNKSRFFYRNGVFIFSGSEEEYYDFLKNKMQHFKDKVKVNVSEKDKRYFNLNKDMLINIDLNKGSKDNFKFSFNIENMNYDNINSIVQAYKEKKTYIKLDDGIFVDLTDPQLIQFLRLLENLDININEKNDEYIIELNKMYYLNNKLNNSSIYNVRNKEMVKNIEERIDDIRDTQFKIPDKLQCSLRSYQVKGYEWFKSLSHLNLGGILADEMGLGKTVQTITFILSEKAYNKKSMIIVPTSLLYNWKNEFEKFSPDLKIALIHGDKKERKAIIDDYENYDVILTTYGTVRNDYALYEDKLFDYLILDEGQNINNYKASITKIIKGLKSVSRFILTGTPIENNLMELWSLFDFLMPGYLYSKDEFASKFMGKDNDNIAELKHLISPYILRRTKKDVIGELPEKVEDKLLVKLSEEQEKLYKTYISDIKNKIIKNELDNNITLFSYLTKLRQICLDPSIILEDYKGHSSKIDAAKDIIADKISEHKILLFSQFTSVLKKIRGELEEEGINYCYLDGSTSSKNRIKLVDEFNTDPDKRVFLISLKAGGTGLNLTSADIVIHFDPWWNPSIHEQASDRAHRIGQKHTVEVIKLVAKDTIEEKIVLLQEDKKLMINEVITGDLKEDNVSRKLNREDILELFS